MRRAGHTGRFSAFVARCVTRRALRRLRQQSRVDACEREPASPDRHLRVRSYAPTVCGSASGPSGGVRKRHGDRGTEGAAFRERALGNVAPSTGIIRRAEAFRLVVRAKTAPVSGRRDCSAFQRGRGGATGARFTGCDAPPRYGEGLFCAPSGLLLGEARYVPYGYRSSCALRGHRPRPLYRPVRRF